MSRVGICECGCGKSTPLATRTRLGNTKGLPIRRLRGHCSRQMKVRPIEERFYSRVVRRGPDECWEWIGARDAYGYGALGARKSMKAHRVSWALGNGAIPAGLSVLHRCDNPPCVNPAHLFLGTQADNIRDMWAKGRANPGGRLLGRATA